MPNVGRKNSLPLRLETKQMCVHTPLLFNILFEVRGDSTPRQEDINYTKARKEETRFSLFVDDIVVYTKPKKIQKIN
jgi:hypothetical protein